MGTAVKALAWRWVYNQTLAVRKQSWEQAGKSVSLYETINMLPEWKKEQPFLQAAYSQSLQEVCERVDLAFQRFFGRVQAGEKPGYPRFKGRNWYKPFANPQSGFELTQSGRYLKLAKIGEVKIKLHRPLEGQVKRLTVKRDKLGNWFACFSCEVEPDPLPPSPYAVGIDLGLSTFAALSDGQKIARQRWVDRDAKDIARPQRKKERCARGSQERAKVVRALRHAYKRAANRRRDFCHQESKKLVEGYQVLVADKKYRFEKLNIGEMQQTGFKSIRKGIAEAAWRQFVQCTAYKAEKAGRRLVLVDPQDTTQQCSNPECQEIVLKDLSERAHDCPYCGLKLDRDHNAALNILGRGNASLGSNP